MSPLFMKDNGGAYVPDEEPTGKLFIGGAAQAAKDKREKDRLEAGVKAMKFRQSPLGKFKESLKPLFAKFQK